jgi:hypothetical protein
MWRAIFFLPYLEIRSRRAGYAVSIVKAGARLAGHDAGPVRPPLVALRPDETKLLQTLIKAQGLQRYCALKLGRMVTSSIEGRLHPLFYPMGSLIEQPSGRAAEPSEPPQSGNQRGRALEFYMKALLDKLKAEGQMSVWRICPRTRFAHLNPCGKCRFNRPESFRVVFSGEVH